MKVIEKDNGYFLVVEHEGVRRRINTECVQYSRTHGGEHYRAFVAAAKARIIESAKAGS